MYISQEEFKRLKLTSILSELIYSESGNNENIILDKHKHALSCHRKTDSPIEQIMFCILINCTTGYGYFYTEKDIEKNGSVLTDGVYAVIKQQEKIGVYKADFVISLVCNKEEIAKIVIECDGHNFHEKTKEQASHDKKRDRYMTANGYKVFRYTGSDLHRSACSIEEEVSDFACDLAIDAINKMAQ